jgi:hypothetical protein
MLRIKLLKIINLFLALSFLLQIATIFLSNFKLHGINGVILITLVFLHIILNFNWIKSNYLKLNKR